MRKGKEAKIQKIFQSLTGRKHRPFRVHIFYCLKVTLNPHCYGRICWYLVRLKSTYRFHDIQAGTEEFFTNLQEMWPNIPILNWWKNKGRKVSDNCWKIPNILDLHYSNKYWQEKRTRNGTFYLYAAYYDVRKVLEISI